MFLVPYGLTLFSYRMGVGTKGHGIFGMKMSIQNLLVLEEISLKNTMASQKL